MKRLLQYAKENGKAIFGLCAIYTIAAALYPLPAVALPKLVIGELSGAGRPEYVLYVVAGYLVLAGLLGFFRQYLDISSRIHLTRLRMGYVHRQFTKLLGMAYPYCEDDHFLDHYEKAFNSTNGNDNGVERVYSALFRMPALALVVAVLAVFIGLREPLILAAIAINIAAVALISRRVHYYRHSLHTELGHASRRLNYCVGTTHDFSYGKDVRVYGFGERVLGNLKKEITGYVDILSLISAKEYAWGFIGLATLALSDAATYGMLVARVVSGMSIADFSMYLAAAASLSLYLKNFITEFTAMLNEGEYVSDLFTYLDEDLGGNEGGRGPIEGDTLEIEFRDVSFKYPKSDKYIYEHLNLTIHKGERLALVGVNGAGKSTLVKLMTGLFPATDGEILINGIPIGDFSKKAVYSMFSAVFQEVNIAAFTVLENIAGTESGDPARAEDALRRAGLWEKIESLPNGLHTMMLKVIDENGAIFSGGEAQKLAIARALYKNANMVVMDEPTAALDALAEQEIYERFGELTHGKTSLYISHRLASTRFCDRIILIDGTGLAEEGTHEELMAARGEYYRMFTIQGKYYQTQAAAEAAEGGEV